jgi:hypothetical protein
MRINSRNWNQQQDQLDGHHSYLHINILQVQL